MYDELIALRYATSGYYVFPLYATKNGPQKPFGWARNQPKKDVAAEKIIPATNDPEIIKQWPDLVRAGYNTDVAGFGVLGVNCIIFDIDVKNGKPGKEEFKKLKKALKLPNPAFVVRSKSGGYHLYYGKPDQYRDSEIKTITNATFNGVKYEGVDIRGTGGFVVGPSRVGPEDTWEEGIYQIVGGGPEERLTEVPTLVANQLARISFDNPLADAFKDTTFSDDIETTVFDKLKRGEIPDTLPNGQRNEGFFLFLTALRNKGFSAETARIMADNLVRVTEDPDTLHESVDIEDMISRLYKINSNNPYDVCIDLFNFGLYRLTSYKSKIQYVMLETNPYISSHSPHDLGSMKQLLARYARMVPQSNGRKKLVNPAELIDATIPEDKDVASMGFKPGAGPIFTMTSNSTRTFLNTWNNPKLFIRSEDHNEIFWNEFKLLISRIFGPEGTDEYQLGLDFVAWILQHPGVKPSIAPIVLSSRRGVGKSLFIKVLRTIFGHNKVGDSQARPYKTEEIAGRFFDPSSSSILLFDEVQFPVHRNMRTETVGFWKHLKNLITDDVYPVEIKGGDTHMMPNMGGVIMAANTGNNFPIEEFDRRIWVIDNDPPFLERGVLDNLFKMSNGKSGRSFTDTGISTLLRELYDHEIKLDLSTIRAPMNEIKKEMYLASLSDIEEWWITHFEDESNMLAATPIISKSAVMYLIITSERLLNTPYQEQPEKTFRELVRRGLIRPIRMIKNPSQTRNMYGIMEVTQTGEIRDCQKRNCLYTTSHHGDYNGAHNQLLIQSYIRNLNTIKAHKESKLQQRQNAISGINHGSG